MVRSRYGTVNIDARPYVQFTGPFTAVIRWDTPDARETIVEYGTSTSLGLRVEDSSAGLPPKAPQELQTRQFTFLKTYGCLSKLKEWQLVQLILPREFCSLLPFVWHDLHCFVFSLNCRVVEVRPAK